MKERISVLKGFQPCLYMQELVVHNDKEKYGKNCGLGT